MDIGVSGVSRVERIGQGAFGVVYRAHQDAFDRTVAVKVLSNIDVDAAAQERFAREVRAVGRLSGHPHIVSVHAHGVTDEGYPYLLMEFCRGGSYGDRLREGRRWSWQEATEVGVAVAGALETSHRAGILHRDVKPDNILIDSYGVPKLADFGIARVSTQGSMTATGVLTGSPAHIAPELVAGEAPSAASDAYSLASTLHTMIAGVPPFVRETDASILPLLQRIAHEPPPRLEAHGVPGPVAEVVRAGMAKNPADRPASCLALAEGLQAARRAAGLAPAPGLKVLDAPGSADPEPPSADETVVPGHPTGSAPAAAPAPAPQAPGPQAPPHPPAPSPAAPPPAAPPPRRRTGGRTALIAVGAVLVLVLGGGAVALALTGGEGSAGPGPGGESSSTRGGGSGSSTGGGSSPAGDTGGPDDIDPAAAARELLFTAPQLGSLDPSGAWQPDSANAQVNANGGFCGEQLPRGPDEFVTQQFFHVPSGQGSLPVAVSAGAVFDSAQEAVDYQATRNASAGCGVWNEGTVSRTVLEPPATPTLVGCECQDVALHEIVSTGQDGSTQTTYTVLAQQERFIAAGFYSVAGGFDPSPEVLQLVAELMDLTVRQVNDVATTYGGEG